MKISIVQTTIMFFAKINIPFTVSILVISFRLATFATAKQKDLKMFSEITGTNEE